MTTFIIVLLLVLLIAVVSVSLWIVNKLTNNIYDLEEQVEQSLDILDVCYRDIGKVLEMPVFYDDPVVKQALNSIKRARDAVLKIANKITASFSNDGDAEDDRQGKFER